MSILKSIPRYNEFSYSATTFVTTENRSAARKGGEHSPNLHKHYKPNSVREPMAWRMPTHEEKDVLRLHIEQGGLERALNEYHSDPKLAEALAQPGALYEEWVHFDRLKPYTRFDNSLVGVFGLKTTGLVIANPQLCTQYGMDVRDALDHEEEHYWHTDPHLTRQAHEERVRDTGMRKKFTTTATQDYRPAMPDTTIPRIRMDERTRAAYENALSRDYNKH